MKNYSRLQHTKWECKYHAVFIPKYRREALFGGLRQYLGEVFRQLAQRKESEIEEGHLRPDHVHMLISIPPKYSVSRMVGFIKERARSTLPGIILSEAEISPGSTFGREVTSFPP